MALVAAPALVLVFSACDIDQTEEGNLPDINVDVDPGSLPEYDVDAPEVDVDMEPVEVEVPTVDIDVDTERRTVEVPDIDVTFPDEEETPPQP